MSADENAGTMTMKEAVASCQRIFAHAWMVRTFVKHSDVVEDFPELMGIVRSVFDTSRSLEPSVSEPAEYLKMLRKKFPKLRTAAAEFREIAPQASDHTNFRQAVISMDGCIAELESILKSFPPAAPPSMPANFRPPLSSVNLTGTADPPPAD